MEEQTLAALVVLAVTVGSVHTLLGPDHYLPFVALARAGRWSYVKTLLITLGCGLGHVLGSVLLGMLGLSLGLAVNLLEDVEGKRGSIAGWMLLGFGLAYTVWGARRALRGATHSHVHVHADGTVHEHPHDHQGGHVHVHADAAPTSNGASRRTGMAPWVLFIIFVFGPCEPLIPILFYPAAAHGPWSTVPVVAAYALSTLITMVVVVSLGYYGFERLRLARWERFSHAGAGVAITACGLAIQFGL